MLVVVVLLMLVVLLLMSQVVPDLSAPSSSVGAPTKHIGVGSNGYYITEVASRLHTPHQLWIHVVAPGSCEIWKSTRVASKG
eukprot:m.54876 g.54876  ORF g.54876 m.54876 type:complete len:82 (-) comp13648_c0_seq8:818-1063(-)